MAEESLDRALKAEGNAAIARGDFLEAVRCYTQALKVVPGGPGSMVRVYA